MNGLVKRNSVSNTVVPVSSVTVKFVSSFSFNLALFPFPFASSSSSSSLLLLLLLLFPPCLRVNIREMAFCRNSVQSRLTPHGFIHLRRDDYVTQHFSG